VPVGIAYPEPLPFRTLIGDLATGQGRPRPRFIPVPPMVAYGALRTAETVGVPLPVRADSLLGLVRPAPMVANVAVLSDLGVDLRPFDGRTGTETPEATTIETGMDRVGPADR
jgi:hypothetical protein